MLFRRPIMEPIHPDTRPLPHERLERLAAFATPGEFEPVTFGVYPVRDLKDFRARTSALQCGDKEIPASAIDLRLVTYWNIGYPMYTSRETFRRTPELLEKVTAHSSPAKECQRFWLKIRVPGDAAPGLYLGTVTVWDDASPDAAAIPLALRVLPFKLKKDPRKHFSAYYYVRNDVAFKGKDEEFIRKATGNEYRAMVEYGLDMLPTLYLRSDDGKRINLRNPEEIDRMMAAGMSGPVPVTADGVIGRFYRDSTPGAKVEAHWEISTMPPPEFYAKVTEAFAAFEKERKEKGWPEFICCPMDEVTAARGEFGAKVYEAVRAAGMRTYATKDPVAADAKPYFPHMNIWCSQPYSIPYEKIVAQDRYEYWSYPNHNAGEIKDPVVMCKGGRMTYGFGFWRSGFTTLIPWHWSWTPAPDPFDYLRGKRSGCGQRIGDDGEVIPAVYWECFREGYDDGRYIYTLQSAIVEREASADAECRKLAAEGKKLLDETWASIEVQDKYLASGMWPSDEFDAVRWRIADLTERLLRFPAAKEAQAPSVLVSDTKPAAPRDTAAALEDEIAKGNVEVLDIGGDWSGWENGTKEGKAEVTEEAGRKGGKGLRWTVTVDHKADGGEGGGYPVGWPRLSRAFKEGELDLTGYDCLLLWIRIDSDRDEVADDRTPVSVLIGSHKAKPRYQKTLDFGDRQRVWIPVRVPMSEAIKSSSGDRAPWTSVSRVQLSISERNYTHGTKLVFDIGGAALLRFKSPSLESIEAARRFLLPCAFYPLSFDVLGSGSVKEGSHTVKAALCDDGGKPLAAASQDLAGPSRMALDASKLSPGLCRLRLEIVEAGGKTCSQADATVLLLPGPLYPR
jgi:hypothetical protein